jgi:hypothetical protein
MKMYTRFSFVLCLCAGLAFVVSCTNDETTAVSKSSQPSSASVAVQPTPEPTTPPKPTPVPGTRTFSLLLSNIERMSEENAVKYGEALAGLDFSGWIGRIQAITEMDAITPIVEVEMHHQRTTLDKGISDVIIKGLSDDVLDTVKVGDIINFSGIFESAGTVRDRKNQFVVYDVVIYGIND